MGPASTPNALTPSGLTRSSHARGCARRFEPGKKELQEHVALRQAQEIDALKQAPGDQGADVQPCPGCNGVGKVPLLSRARHLREQMNVVES